MTVDRDLLDRFHRILVREIRSSNPEYLEAPFTVAEIYQHLVPYRTHRDELGVKANGEYEELLMRLLSGEGDYLVLDSEPALRRIREELREPAPNTGLFREFAAAEVRLNPDRVVGEHLMGEGREPAGGAVRAGGSGRGGAADPGSGGAGAQGETVPGEGEAPSLWEGGASDPGAAPEAGEPAPAGAGTPSPPASSPGGNGQARTLPFGQPTVHDVPEECPECAGDLPPREGLRFCPHCGVNVHVVPCPECQGDLERSWNFCIYCGTTVGG